MKKKNISNHLVYQPCAPAITEKTILFPSDTLVFPKGFSLMVIVTLKSQGKTKLDPFCLIGDMIPRGEEYSPEPFDENVTFG